MFSRYRRYRTLQTLRHHGLPDHLWRKIRKDLYLLRGLDPHQAASLRKLTTLLLHEKNIHGVQGLRMTLEMRTIIISQACLMILNLNPSSFDGWNELIVYPGAFKVERTITDEFGISHQQASPLSGEAWQNGPLILSWDDVQRDSFTPHSGSHVVIHEFAHKLDALNGRVNGMPPLHPNMSIEKWSEVLSNAYATLQKDLARGKYCINPYAATNPAEFFAVLSEYFFTAPQILKQVCNDVYKQLALYYRQTPVLTRDK